MHMTYRELLRLANAFSESQTLLAANDLDVFTAIVAALWAASAAAALAPGVDRALAALVGA